jgi:hypothetical protein
VLLKLSAARASEALLLLLLRLLLQLLLLVRHWHLCLGLHQQH